MVKKKLTEQQRKERAYETRIQVLKLKKDFVRNTFNGRYYLERCNMMAEQISDDAINEKIDGQPKSKNLMIAEYSLMRMQAIDSFRGAHFDKKSLMEDFNLTEEDLEALLNGYHQGKIIREDYDGDYTPDGKAEFTAA